MDEKHLNKAEGVVNEVKWTVNDYAERVKDYICEQKEKNEAPSKEGWLERAKENMKDAWEDTKDAASDVWEKTKDWTEDVKAEIRKATN